MAGLAYSYSDLLDTNLWALILIILLFCYLLVADLPMFALKIKSLAWQDNKNQYVFLIGSVIILAFFGLDAFSIIIAWYIILSLILYLLKPKA